MITRAGMRQNLARYTLMLAGADSLLDAPLGRWLDEAMNATDKEGHLQEKVFRHIYGGFDRQLLERLGRADELARELLMDG